MFFRKNPAIIAAPLLQALLRRPWELSDRRVQKQEGGRSNKP
jgi:hypothetical protein